MFTFSAVEIELSYLIAKADFTKLQIETAKAKKKSTKELKEKLELTQQLINQLQNRINATIN
jgi:S-adenosylmethionine synthetase